MQKRILLCLIIAFIITSDSIVFGQINPPPTTSFGSIRGRVTDSFGTGLGGVTVEVVGGNTFATTDSNGNYSITNLPQGAYTITASLSGYETVKQSVFVYAGKTTELNFALPKAQPKSIGESTLLLIIIILCMTAIIIALILKPKK